MSPWKLFCSSTILRNISHFLLSVLERKEKKSVFSGTVYFIRAVFVCVCVSVCLNSGAEVWLNASRVWRQINAITFLSPSSAKRNQLRHALVIYVGEAWANGWCAAWIFFFSRGCGLLKTKLLQHVIYLSSFLSFFKKKYSIAFRFGSKQTVWKHQNAVGSRQQSDDIDAKLGGIALLSTSVQISTWIRFTTPAGP